MKFHGMVSYVGPVKSAPSKFTDGGEDVYCDVVVKGVGRADYAILCRCYHEPAKALRARWEKNGNRIPFCGLFDIDLHVATTQGTGTEPMVRQLTRLTSYAFVQPSDPKTYDSNLKNETIS